MEVTKMKKLVTRYYYTLWDIASLEFEPYLDYLGNADDQEIALGTLVELTVQHNVFDQRWSSLDTTISKKMFTQYLWPEFQNCVVLYIDVEHDPWEEPEEPTDEEIVEAFCEKAPQWIRWYQESSEKYGKLISLLTSIENNLLDQLGSENMTLFTDTPENGSGWLSNQDDYVTNATKVTNKADVATPIARLKEVQDNLRNYYADWADEFSRFVIYSA